MHDPRKIAQAYVIEGEVDIKLARLALDHGFYSKSLYFSQQAAEKMVRACIILKGVITKEHNISALFVAVYPDLAGGDDGLIAAVKKLESYGAKAYLPLFQRDDLPIWIPSRSIREAEARDNLERGELVFGRLKALLDKELAGVHG